MADRNITVRTVTVFLPEFQIRTTDLSDVIQKASAKANETASELRKAGITVQTTRLAAPSPASFGTPQSAISAAKVLEQANVDHISVGTVLPAHTAFHNKSFFTTLLAETKVFATLTVTSGQTIYPRLASLAAEIVKANTPYEDGLRNFRFSVLANVHPGCPFFPAAYAPDSDELPVSLGVQAAELAYDDITRTIETIAKKLDNITTYPITLDFSLAPFPTKHSSTARAITTLANVPSFPSPGCLLASARLTQAIQRANFPKAGLNGIMLPVLEDVGLNTATVTDLLTCSAVCGTGLDAIPLPGDVGEESLQGIFLDVAAMACRLGKQLTARVVPVPGKVAGEVTEFQHEFLCNTPVLAVREVPKGMGVREEIVEVVPLGGYLPQ